MGKYRFINLGAIVDEVVAERDHFDKWETRLIEENDINSLYSINFMNGAGDVLFTVKIIINNADFSCDYYES